ncbi:MAG: 50S ribosomal protein L10 [Actinomycetota bacterium]|nr:50S ribosomal protein L10 [Actinomycetota bacterium]
MVTTRSEPRPDKVAVVAEVEERLRNADAVLLTEYRGLNVGHMAELRRSLSDAGCEYKIYKNTLVRFAARNVDLDIDDLLTGPTAIAFVSEQADGTRGDAVTAAKALRDFGRDHPALIIKGGVMGSSVLSADDATKLADVAPREELLARLAGGLAAPMQQFAGLLEALPRNFAYALSALVDKGGAAGTDTGATAETPAASDAGDDTENESAPATEES